jgi:hypothetical protein
MQSYLTCMPRSIALKQEKALTNINALNSQCCNVKALSRDY